METHSIIWWLEVGIAKCQMVKHKLLAAMVCNANELYTCMQGCVCRFWYRQILKYSTSLPFGLPYCVTSASLALPPD